MVLFASGKDLLKEMFEVELLTSKGEDLITLDDDANNDELTPGVSELVPTYKISRIKTDTEKDSTVEEENQNAVVPNNMDAKDDEGTEKKVVFLEEPPTSDQQPEQQQKEKEEEESKVTEETTADTPTNEKTEKEIENPEKDLSEEKDLISEEKGSVPLGEEGRTEDKIKIYLSVNKEVPAITYCVAHILALPNPAPAPDPTSTDLKQADDDVNSSIVNDDANKDDANKDDVNNVKKVGEDETLEKEEKEVIKDLDQETAAAPPTTATAEGSGESKDTKETN